jgi:hypothetical protein
MKSISIVVAFAVICGCSAGKSGSSQLSLSVKSNALSAADAGTAASAAVSRIRISVASLKLEGPAAGADAGLVQDVEISEGPFLVDLSGAALAGSIEQVFDTSVPAGSYGEFSLSIAPATAAALGDLATQGVSLIVDGAFNGAPFTFTSKMAFSEKKEGTFTVGDGTSNITLAIDPSTWFGTAAAPLDPTVAANSAAIEANIQASFKAFRDDNRNGDDDDGEDVGDDHGHDGADAGDDHGQNDGGDHGKADAGDDHGHDDAGAADAGAADAGDDHGGNTDGGSGHH